MTTSTASRNMFRTWRRRRRDKLLSCLDKQAMAAYEYALWKDEPRPWEVVQKDVRRH